LVDIFSNITELLEIATGKGKIKMAKLMGFSFAILLHKSLILNEVVEVGVFETPSYNHSKEASTCLVE